MWVYNYHPMTGEYLSQEVAHPNPLEPGNYLVPAFATTIAPPAAVGGRTAIFADGGWSLVEDHRGETFWRGKTYGVWTALGPVPPGFSKEKPSQFLAIRRMTMAAVVAFHLTGQSTGSRHGKMF